MVGASPLAEAPGIANGDWVSIETPEGGAVVTLAAEHRQSPGRGGDVLENCKQAV
jgi:anaerobic selenocysteine-containing dehydrogenase